MPTGSYLGGSTVFRPRDWSKVNESWDVPEYSVSSVSNPKKVPRLRKDKFSFGPVINPRQAALFNELLHYYKSRVARSEKRSPQEGLYLKLLYASIQWCQKNNRPISRLVREYFINARVGRESDHGRDVLRFVFMNYFPGMRLRFEGKFFEAYIDSKYSPESAMMTEEFFRFLRAIVDENWKLLEEMTK